MAIEESRNIEPKNKHTWKIKPDDVDLEKIQMAMDVFDKGVLTLWELRQRS